MIYCDSSMSLVDEDLGTSTGQTHEPKHNTRIRENKMKAYVTLLLTAVLMTTMAHTSAGDTGETHVRTILDALKTGEVDALRSVLTEEFASDLTDQAIRDLSRPIRSHLQGGYGIHHLGVLTQDDFPVQFWKISFEDREEDALLRIVIFDGRVAGFLITRPFV